MPRFHYTAIHPNGETLVGEVDGADPAEARAALLAAGLQVTALQLMAEPTGNLSFAEAAAITQQIANATQSQLPLVGSLRAYAEEVCSSGLRDRLIQVCDSLEAGESLEQVLSNPALRLPPAVSAILDSGLPQGAINHLLSQTMRTATTNFELRSRAFLLMSYTGLMMLTICGLWLFLLVAVTPQFAKIFADFGTELPSIVEQLIAVSNLARGWNAVFTLLALVVVGVVLAAVLISMSAAERRRIWCGVPIVGSMYRLTALSEFANLLALMLESKVPLPQAVVWSAAGANDADLRVCCDAIADRLRLGDDPADFNQSASALPAYLQQMLRWSAQGADGAEPLRATARLLQLRAKSISLIALPLLEPVMLIATVISIVVYVVVMFLPLIKLLNDLS